MKNKNDKPNGRQIQASNCITFIPGRLLLAPAFDAKARNEKHKKLEIPLRTFAPFVSLRQNPGQGNTGGTRNITVETNNIVPTALNGIRLAGKNEENGLSMEGARPRTPHEHGFNGKHAANPSIHRVPACGGRGRPPSMRGSGTSLLAFFLECVFTRRGRVK